MHFTLSLAEDAHKYVMISAGSGVLQSMEASLESKHDTSKSHITNENESSL